jgi:hypothetical protein
VIKEKMVVEEVNEKQNTDIMERGSKAQCDL